MMNKFWRRKKARRKKAACEICNHSEADHTSREILTQNLLAELDSHEHGREFLFGDPGFEDRRDMNVIRLPSDPNVVSAWYNGIREPRNGEHRAGITYDADAAHQHLTDIVRNMPINQRKPNDT